MNIYIDIHNSFDPRYLSITDINRLITVDHENRLQSIFSIVEFHRLGTPGETRLLTAIMVVLLLDFETRLQHYFLSSYSLETVLNRIHKHIQSVSSPNILECCALFLIRIL